MFQQPMARGSIDVTGEMATRSTVDAETIRGAGEKEREGRERTRTARRSIHPVLLTLWIGLMAWSDTVFGSAPASRRIFAISTSSACSHVARSALPFSDPGGGRYALWGRKRSDTCDAICKAV